MFCFCLALSSPPFTPSISLVIVVVIAVAFVVPVGVSRGPQSFPPVGRVFCSFFGRGKKGKTNFECGMRAVLGSVCVCVCVGAGHLRARVSF